MAARKPQKIAAIENVALNERANLRINQWPQRFKRIEYKAVPMRLVLMEKSNCEARAACRKRGPDAPGFPRIGKIQNGIDRIRRMTRAAHTNAACTLFERTKSPQLTAQTFAPDAAAAGRLG
jgi:hypothetical protein